MMKQDNAAKLLEDYQAAFKLIDAKNDDIFSGFRKKNWHDFLAVGLPGFRQENWKYTHIARYMQQFAFEDVITTSTAHIAVKPLNDVADIIQMQDGQIIKASNQSYQFVSLNTPPDDMPITLDELLNLSTYQHGLRLLNNALLHQGAILFVPANTVINVPVELFMTTSEKQKDKAQNTRLLIVLGENAKLDLVQHYQGSAEHYFENSITDVYLSNNAKLNHIIVQRAGMRAVHSHGVYVTEEAKSNYHAFTLDLGSQLARRDIYVNLKGEHTRVQLNGLYIGNDKQLHDNHSEIYHRADCGESSEFYRGVLDDHAIGVFNGKVFVDKGTKKTNSKQQNNNLLLSKKAQANTKPSLQIYAEDVQCSHGATVGQLDEESLFYLRSRGIDAEYAKTLLLHAFISDVIADYHSTDYTESITNLALAKLTQTVGEV